jgi:myo-inositol-1(or 4)-monophosphatase
MSVATEANPEILRQAGELAMKLAYEAGTLLRDALRVERRITYKGSIDLVTDADEAAEKLIVEGIHAAFPDHRLTGEEGSTGAETSDYGWVIDPLDGTTNFAHGYAHFAVSIALEFRGEPVVGAVYDPTKDEMFFAVQGQGATLNGEPIHVSVETELVRALGATGFSYDVNDRVHAFALWEAFNTHARGMRRGGSAALDMVWVAAGRLDAYFERPINSWDVGAGVIIAREAGATVTSMDGSPYRLDAGEVCCTNGALHGAVVELIGSTLAGIH